MFRPSPPPKQVTPTTVAKPSIAVLFFDNMSKEPELDWLRVGLADMLSTDLAQSPDIRVLTTDRVYQILEEMDRLDAPITSFAVVKEVADRGHVENVLIGSFMKAQDNIRISVRLQEVTSGDVLTSEHVEGVGEASIFSMADQLTERVRAELEIPQTATFRPIEELTTSSPTAYRLFVEGVVLRRKEMNTEAIALFEKAVDTDPKFAEAHRALATAHWNMGHDVQGERHARLALAQRDRLPPTERYQLEGRVNSFREEDFALAIDSFKNLAEIGGSANNLAYRYILLERYDEAIEVLEEYKRARGGKFTGIAPYSNLIIAYTTLEKYNKAHIVYQEMLERIPEGASTVVYLGGINLFWNRLDDAMRAFDKAESYRSGFSRARNGRWWVSVLEEDWERAATEAAGLKESDDERWRWQGRFNQSILELYKGRTPRALQLLNLAAEVFEEPGLLAAWAHSMSGHVLLESHQFSDCVNRAKLAQEYGKGNPPEWEGLFLESLSLARQGKLGEAKKTAETLQQRTEPMPTQKEKRRHLHLIGELALTQKHATQAIEYLEQAKSMVPPRGPGSIHGSRVGPPTHVPIWYSLASAYLASGDDDKAAERFQRIIDCGVERVGWPIYYVRSFYFLGKIHENRGEMEKAREHYQHFVDYWKDGDIDRERVEEALSKIRSSSRLVSTVPQR
jgi:tetratricopeptide (TPR) repeat protein